MLPSFAPDQTAAILAAFQRDGIACVRQVLGPATISRLRALADQALDAPTTAGQQVEPVYATPVLRNTQSLDPYFAEFLLHPPFPTWNTALFGADYGFCGQNVIRSDKDQAINIWHVDDELEFPAAPDLDGHDPRERLPVLWYSLQIALSDITHPDDGPTEVVPGSHYSGRLPPRNREQPDEAAKPSWHGRATEPVLCQAGDVYLFNHQLWHRGSPNRSGKRRYLMQNQYCRGWLVRRFIAGPHRTCALPPAQYAALPAEVRRLLPAPA